MATPLIDSDTRHQVYIERYKSQVANDFIPFLKEIESSLRSQLAEIDLTEISRTRLEKQLTQTRKLLRDIYTGWSESLSKELADFADYESKYAIKQIADVMETPFDFTVPTEKQLITAVTAAPLSVRGIDGGKLLDDFIKDFSDKDTARLTNIIRQGYFEGKTNRQMVSQIMSQELAATERSARAIVRTAVQHTASQARQATAEANSDLIKGVKWSSTLDSRTTPICQSLDGREFPIDSGPRPPIHIGCRSQTTYVLSDKYSYLSEGRTRAARDPKTGKTVSVSGKETYFSWLKKQDKEFVEDAIGRDKAKLLLNGGITGEEFSRLQLGSNFKPLTLAQMKEKNPLAFAKAGL